MASVIYQIAIKETCYKYHPSKSSHQNKIDKEKSGNLKIGRWNWMCWIVHSSMCAQPKVYSFINYDKDVNPNIF